MARYIPGNVADAVLREELAKIAEAMDAPNQFLSLDTLYAAPTKFREGTVVKAGAPWNPGSGDGFYGYRAGSWRFLG